MKVVASAPGKMVLSGEYAVLEGAPALVAAVDRRAVVTLESLPEPVIIIDAAELEIRGATACLDASGRFVLEDAQLAAANRLALVGSVIEAVAVRTTLPGLRATLDTRAFFTAEPPPRKYGLGSSAALAVALGGALHALLGLGRPHAEALMAAHRRAQGGSGSGLDIAASLVGGVISYRCDGGPHTVPVSWPDALQFCCVWSRRPASTGVFLRSLAAWRQHSPAHHAGLMRDLAARAAVADAALRHGQLDAFIAAVDAYADGLAALGAASGLDIMSAEHRVLRALAADCGVAYKPCGAGGGDVGMAVTMDAGRMLAFRHAVEHAGLAILDVQPALHGLQVN